MAIDIDLRSAMLAGIPFYTSVNNVILTPGDENGVIHPKFFVAAAGPRRDASTFRGPRRDASIPRATSGRKLSADHVGTQAFRGPRRDASIPRDADPRRLQRGCL